jgi:hypothetical protein
VSSSSSSPFWSLGMVLSQTAGAILHMLFVTLLVGALATPRHPDHKPVLANWFSAFVLASLAMSVFNLVAHLGVSYLQNQSFVTCQAANAQASVSDCYAMPLVTIGHAVIAVASFALFMAVLTLQAKPAGGAASDSQLTENIILGAIAGAVLAVVGMLASAGIGQVVNLAPDMYDALAFSLVYTLLYAVLDGLVLAIMLGIWRTRLRGGTAVMAARFD